MIETFNISSKLMIVLLRAQPKEEMNQNERKSDQRNFKSNKMWIMGSLEHHEPPPSGSTQKGQ
jgi:hypothetical protein